MVDNRSRVLASPLTRSRISRRNLVAGAGALAAASTLTTYRPASAQSFSGKIRFQAGAYTPSESMEKTPNNPIPHDALQRVADQYVQMYPDVEIEFVRVPEGTDARVWTVTQLTGGNAPEIVWTQSFDTNRDVGKGWWTNLLPYMEEPNPYVTEGPGTEQWIDQFFEGPTGAKFAANGEIYVVPYDLVTTFFFYNKTIFEQAGITEIPTTYSQFLEMLAQLQETGTPAYNGLQWSRPQLGEMLIGAWKSEFEPTGIGGAYTQKDIALAILDGIYDATKIEYKEWLRLMKEGVQYWAQQWPDENAAEIFERQFTQGQLGIFEDGSWRFGLLNANDQLQFEWGSFFMPMVEVGTGPGQSEHATGEPAPSIGGATAIQYGITNSAEKNGVLDLCVDWLRYITAPTQASEIIAELGQFLPNIKGVEVNEDLRGPLEAVASGPGEAGMIAYGDKIDAEAAAQIDTATNNYLLDRAELDETAQAIQDLLYAQAEASAEANGWR